MSNPFLFFLDLVRSCALFLQLAPKQLLLQVVKMLASSSIFLLVHLSQQSNLFFLINIFHHSLLSVLDASIAVFVLVHQICVLFFFGSFQGFFVCLNSQSLQRQFFVQIILLAFLQPLFVIFNSFLAGGKLFNQFSLLGKYGARKAVFLHVFELCFY